jgi:hypothetical protein
VPVFCAAGEDPAAAVERELREPDSGDLEEMELITLPATELVTPARLVEMAVLGYVTLTLLAARDSQLDL